MLILHICRPPATHNRPEQTHLTRNCPSTHNQVRNQVAMATRATVDCPACLPASNALADFRCASRLRAHGAL
eukprot:8141003-Lingulodinium_polyedra.AAC.1